MPAQKHLQFFQMSDDLNWSFSEAFEGFEDVFLMLKAEGYDLSRSTLDKGVKVSERALMKLYRHYWDLFEAEMTRMQITDDQRLPVHQSARYYAYPMGTRIELNRYDDADRSFSDKSGTQWIFELALSHSSEVEVFLSSTLLH